MNAYLDQLKEEVYRQESVQKVCDLMMSTAASMGTSDIHIEPMAHVVRIRFRIDGEMREILEYQSFFHQQVVARFKILANLKIDESRMPQDGRISTTIDGRPMDLRVSTLPTVSWEKIVMRLIDKSKKTPSLDQLGIEGHNREVLDRGIAAPNGIVLTSGPTGSGKSTTLYSCLLNLNTPDVNIMTLEDPVENTLEGINQSQMHPDIGFTFASGLRTALRQDPDIIMVGEIRDKETISIAIEASLTGHLVLSTIHTNSAAETITRILNMGIPGFLLPAAINAIIAQRLIRRLCPHCKRPVTAHELDQRTQDTIRKAILKTRRDELDLRVNPETLANPVFYEPVGCDKCNMGYKGRVGIYEIMEITSELKKLILEGASGVELNEAAINGGMVSLEQDGVIKALNGLTSLSEVYSAAKEG